MNATSDHSRRRARGAVVMVAAALGIVLITAAVWWFTNRDDPAEADLGASSGDAGGQVVKPDPRGDGVPGDPGSAPPGSGPEDPPAGDPAPPMTAPDGVPINGFVEQPGTRLALNYTTGVPECYGELDTPEVVESDEAVTITLRLVPPERTGQPCIELAVLKTVRVQLEAPLAGRTILDGSFGGEVEVKRMRHTYE